MLMLFFVWCTKPFQFHMRQYIQVNTLALVAQNQCTESNQDHDYLQVVTRDDPGDDVLIFVDTNFC